MTKKEFIQRVIARTVPPLEKVATGVAYAEHLWHKLTEHGYGTVSPTGARDSKDWYRLLQGESKKQFDAFWKSFNHKQGKQRAAMRWHQMGDLAPSTAKQIIAAAAKEAARPLAPGAVRKMAEGWLAEQRWQDHETTAAPKQETTAKQITDLMGDLAALKRLNRNGALDQQITDREQQIKALRGG